MDKLILYFKSPSCRVLYKNIFISGKYQQFIKPMHAARESELLMDHIRHGDTFVKKISSIERVGHNQTIVKLINDIILT